MTLRVYRYGCLPPIEGVDVVRAQLRAAHDYRNDLVAIERGRRAALRAIDDTPEVRDAIDRVKGAAKKDRPAAVTLLRTARKAAREVASEDLSRIQALDESIRRDARALTPCYWGTYLSIEAAHQQARSAPLYGNDAITPSDPAFVRWRMPMPGQVGIQIQATRPLTTAEALRGQDTRVRLVMSGPVYGVLWLRVGSEGRDPVWAHVPIKLHRAVPDAATWKWVRVSVRPRGTREVWTCEITVDDPSPPARSLDGGLDESIAIEWDWTQLDDGSVRVASWADSRGRTGEERLPARIVSGIRKAEGLHAIRDLVADDVRSRVARELRECGEVLPPWLVHAREALAMRGAAKVSIAWMRDLVHRWRRERCDVARRAYERLDDWWIRDAHLYDYETGARRNALGWRRDVYRCLARRWGGEYRTVLLSDQDLSREARFGEEASVRQLASVHELRDAVRNVFGGDAVGARWRDKPDEEDERSWCERSRDEWMAEGARKEDKFTLRQEKQGNAWAKRKAKKVVPRAEHEPAREAVSNPAE